MPLTTPELVEGIIDVDSSIDLTPFIAVADSLVQEIAPNTSFNDPNRLTLIETWLAAHFYTCRDPRPTMERIGGQQGAGVEEEYQTKVGLNLATSHFGQMAMVLDTSGQLRLLSDKGKRILTVTWLGSGPPCPPPSCPPAENDP